MNVQRKSPVSGVVKKIVLTAALVAGALVILGGVVLNMDKSIIVQARIGGVTARQEFSSLPEYDYIMAHNLSELPAYAIALGVTLPRVASAPSALSRANKPFDFNALALKLALPRVASSLPFR